MHRLLFPTNTLQYIIRFNIFLVFKRYHLKTEHRRVQNLISKKCLNYIFATIHSYIEFFNSFTHIHSFCRIYSYVGLIQKATVELNLKIIKYLIRLWTRRIGNANDLFSQTITCILEMNIFFCFL